MKKAKVLYVEDETFLAKIVSETLQGRGYEVVLEEDGGKAVQQFEKSKPDVCVLDIMLPNKDGFAIADEIRERDANVPIIFLSAKSQTSDVVNGFRMGANDYIRKPFSMEELIVRIENVLKNKPQQEELEEVQLGQFTFNVRRQTLGRGDQREVMERNFVVTDTMEKLNWKLSDETKTILNRTARKAIAQRISTRPMVTMENGEMKRTEVADTSKIIAWYTTEIPVSAGPAFYQGQLPGLILELDINNGRQLFKAIEITAKDNIAAKIKEPKEGKKVTAAEFQKERDKLMEEMRKNMPQGNVIRMQ